MLRTSPKRLQTINVLVAAISLSAVPASKASDVNARVAAAQNTSRNGDFDGTLKQLEPLLSANDLDQPTKQHVHELAAHVLQLRGEEHFREGRVANSIADFKRQVQLQPDHAAENWQLGIAFYYAGEYENGARQFELHQKVNPQDVENAAWHFLCVVRTPKQSLETARKRLIPVTRDSRVPMAQIYQMFAGTIRPEEVLSVGRKVGGSAEFYADLYVGLYFEALNRIDESLRLIKKAAANSAAKDNYMGDVARIHVALRTKNARPAKNQ